MGDMADTYNSLRQHKKKDETIMKLIGKVKSKMLMQSFLQKVFIV